RVRRPGDSGGRRHRRHRRELATQRVDGDVSESLADHPGRSVRYRRADLPGGPDRSWPAPARPGAPGSTEARAGHRHRVGRGARRMSAAATLLYVESLTVSFDGFLALRNLNLIVDRTERVRLLIGPNGAGKTTLFDALTGHVVPVSGRVLFHDTVNLLGRSPHIVANLGVMRKFQTPSVFPGHTVFENM